MMRRCAAVTKSGAGRSVGSDGSGRRIGPAVRMSAAVVAFAFMGIVAPRSASASFIGDGELRAVLYNKSRADTLGVPLVLLAHRTHANMQGNGARQIDEDLLWYVRDPSTAGLDRIAQTLRPIDRSIEAFSIRRFRVFRGADTLAASTDTWQPQIPAGWPPAGNDPYFDVRGVLPPLEPGDVVETAYSIVNPGSRYRIPADWERFLLRSPIAPTVARWIVINFNPAAGGQARVINDVHRLIRHFGAAVPETELLTGNLAAGPTDADSLNGPAVLFTSSKSWGPARRVLAEHYYSEMVRAQSFLGAIGDSLMRAHRSSRERAAAVLDLIEKRCARIPRPLIGSSYYPRPLALAWEQRTADPIDRALLVTALADGAKLKTDLLLARSDPGGFDPKLVTPLQFDRLVIRVMLAEEDRHILIDPWAADLESANRVAPSGGILLGLHDDWARLLRLTENGELVDAIQP